VDRKGADLRARPDQKARPDLRARESNRVALVSHISSQRLIRILQDSTLDEHHTCGCKSVSPHPANILPYMACARRIRMYWCKCDRLIKHPYRFRKHNEAKVQRATYTFH
jgi:hypothetical protein